MDTQRDGIGSESSRLDVTARKLYQDLAIAVAAASANQTSTLRLGGERPPVLSMLAERSAVGYGGLSRTSTFSQGLKNYSPVVLMPYVGPQSPTRAPKLTWAADMTNVQLGNRIYGGDVQ